VVCTFVSLCFDGFVEMLTNLYWLNFK
jgi:hypothetical protein